MPGKFHLSNDPRGSFWKGRKPVNKNAAGTSKKVKQMRVREGTAAPLVGERISNEVADFFKSVKEPARASFLHWQGAFEKHLKNKSTPLQLSEELLADLCRGLMTRKVASDRLIKVVDNPRETHYGALIIDPAKLKAKLEAAVEEIKAQPTREAARKVEEEKARAKGESLPRARSWISEVATRLMGKRVFIDGESLKAMREHVEQGNLHYIFGKAGRKA